MDNQNLHINTSIKDYIEIIFRYKKLICGTILAVLITVVIGLELKTPLYESQVKMLISGTKQIESAYYRDIIMSQTSQVALTQSEIVKSNPVLERSTEVLELDKRPADYELKFCSNFKRYLLTIKPKSDKTSNLSPEEQKTIAFNNAVKYLKAHIDVEPIVNTNMFLIKATDFSPENAAKIANIVSRSYVIFDLQQQLAEVQTKYGFKHPSVEQLRNTIWTMNQNLSGNKIPDIEAIGPASVKIIEQANTPSIPKGQSKKTVFFLSFVLSSILGIILAFIFQYLNQSFRTPQDMVNFLKTPFLGSIPKLKKWDKTIISDLKTNDIYIKFYQDLTDQLNVFMKVQNRKTILFTSVNPKDGNSTIISNMAICFSSMLNYKTLIIDANFKNPDLHNIFNIDSGEGLSDILKNDSIKIENLIKDIDSNLAFISAGETCKTSHFNELSKIELVLEKVTKKYDVILIDSANLNDSRDSIVLASYVDGLALVLSEGKTRREVAKNILTNIRQKKIEVLGVILNNRSFAIPEFIYKRM